MTHLLLKMLALKENIRVMRIEMCNFYLMYIFKSC